MFKMSKIAKTPVRKTAVEPVVYGRAKVYMNDKTKVACGCQEQNNSDIFFIVG